MSDWNEGGTSLGGSALVGVLECVAWSMLNANASVSQLRGFWCDCSSGKSVS